MKVWFSCPVQDITKYKDTYLLIRDTIKSEGHELTRDWIERSIKLNESGAGERPKTDVYPLVIEATLAADVVIIDGTVSTFNLGLQVDFAIQKNKPVLFLSQQKQEDLENSFMAGTKSNLLTMKSYTKDTVKDIIIDFLNIYEGGSKSRFNLVIDQNQSNYLDWAAFTYKKNKTDIIKESIDQRLNNDTRYQGYMGN